MGTFIHKFESQAAFEAAYNNLETYREPWTSLVEGGSVAYNNPNPPQPVPPTVEAGMICYYDGSTLKFCSRSDWNNSLGTPVGVVVVPSNHTNDGTVRIAAITSVNADGSSASTDVGIGWGPTNTDTGLPNMDKVPTWDNTIGGTVGSAAQSFLPSDNNNGYFTGSTDVISGVLKYYHTSGAFIPSPYLADGSQNPDYINVVEATTANCLSDFDGKGNTAVLVGLGSAYSAANACHLYSTAGISAGNWYLPACGELGYIMPRFMEIQRSLSTVDGVLLVANYCYWSSTEYNISYARYVDTLSGTVNGLNKNGGRYVRPFASIPVLPLSF